MQQTHQEWRAPRLSSDQWPGQKGFYQQVEGWFMLIQMVRTLLTAGKISLQFLPASPNNFKQSYSRWFVGGTLARNRKNISLQNVESQLSKLWPSILVFGHIHPSIHPSIRPSVRPSVHPSIHSSHQHVSTPTSSVLSQDDKAPVKHSIESKR